MELLRTVRVGVPGGIHARPAAEIVRLSKTFQSEVLFEVEDRQAAARSSLKLIMLRVKEGAEIKLRARGDDAADAIESLAAYLESGGEQDGGGAAEAAPQPQSAQLIDDVGQSGEKVLQGLAGGGGPALGPAFVFRQPKLDPFPPSAGTVAERTAEARAAIDAVGLRLDSQASEAASTTTRTILTAIAELARDPEWFEAVEAEITAGLSAGEAVLTSGKRLASELSGLDNPYAEARSEDVASVTTLVALQLQGKQPLALASAPPGAIIVADELGAAELGATDLTRLGGLILKRGSVTSHAAILARNFGVPSIFGLSDPEDRLSEAELIALDGSKGLVYPDPSEDRKKRFEADIEAAAAEAEGLNALIDVAPATRDGTSITVAANIGSVDDIARAKASGAMGVGLFRTEFLFMDRATLPDEKEQFKAYRAALKAFPDQPVVIRTLDIGADKPVRGVSLAHEDNPFLGLRGIRLCLKQPDLFRTQLRALLRAAAEGKLHVMLPMVSQAEEIVQVKQLIEDCRAELARENQKAGTFSLGIMVETPAAVFAAAQLAEMVGFFSIGTNDLTQYVMAADRMNPEVAGLCRADQPAVLAAIRQVCAAAASAGIWVGVCGEAAGDPTLVPALLAAGVRELSMSPASVLRIKKVVGTIDLANAAAAADRRVSATPIG